MSKSEHFFVRFELVEGKARPCVKTKAIFWHCKHGWVYNVWSNVDQRYLGVFYCTLLGGDGVILHFENAVDDIAVGDILCAFKKGVAMMSRFNLVLATVPAEKKLNRIVKKLGFSEIAQYQRDKKTIILYKFLKNIS